MVSIVEQNFSDKSMEKKNRSFPLIEVENYYFKYHDIDYDILHNISFSVNRGDFILLFGPSGSGKSTLCYSLTGLIPWSIEGYFKGKISIMGKDLTNLKPNQIAGDIALLMQNPESQFINLTAYDELVFGAENLKFSREKIKKKLAEIVDLLQIDHLLQRNVMKLSGGEKQRIVLGSVLMMEPKILILDEPLAFLDAKGRKEVINYLSLIQKRYQDLAIIISEHRIKDIAPYANKFMYLNNGDIIESKDLKILHLGKEFDYGFDPSILITDIDSQFQSENYRSDFTNKNSKKSYKIHKKVYTHEKYYEDLLKGLNFEPVLNKGNNSASKNQSELKIEEKLPEQVPLLSFKDVTFDYIQDNGKYKRIKKTIFDKIDFVINKNEKVGILGINGSGKSTLLYLISGILSPKSGSRKLHNVDINSIPYNEYAKSIGLIFQNPESQLLKSSIKEELEFGPKNFGVLDSLSDSDIEENISLIFASQKSGIASKFGESNLSSLNPFNLSWGQKRRLNFASLTTYHPEIYLLDEPFTGQDYKTRKKITDTLLSLLKNDKTAIIASHDDDILEICDRILLVHDKTVTMYTKNTEKFKKKRKLKRQIKEDSIN